jgi:hypothetical protein
MCLFKNSLMYGSVLAGCALMLTARPSCSQQVQQPPSPVPSQWYMKQTNGVTTATMSGNVVIDGSCTSNAATSPEDCGGAGGGVTSVAVTGTNIGVAGSPITSTGTIALDVTGDDVDAALGYVPASSANAVTTSGGTSGQCAVYTGATTVASGACGGSFTSGGSTTLSVPSGSAGTVGSNSWSMDPSGRITNRVCEVFEDGTDITWTFLQPFVNGPLGFGDINAASPAGQGGNAPNATLELISWTPTSATFDVHQTNIPGTLVSFCVTADGY